MIEKKIANRLCPAAEDSQTSGCCRGRASGPATLAGTCGCQKESSAGALGLTVSRPGCCKVTVSVPILVRPCCCSTQAHLALCSIDAESLGWLSFLMEWDETLKLKPNEWLNELQILHFHPLVNCAACCCLCCLLSCTRNLICNECVSCPGGSSQRQVELSRTDHLSLKSGWSLTPCS